VASLSSIRRILSVIQRAPVSVAQVNHIRSHDVQSEKRKERLLLCSVQMIWGERRGHGIMGAVQRLPMEFSHVATFSF